VRKARGLQEGSAQGFKTKE